MAELPEDVLVSDIFPRLPLESIGRFRCVSKLWRSWLSIPQFVKHHMHIHNSPESLIIKSAYRASYFYISTMATKSCISDENTVGTKKVITSPLFEPDGSVHVDCSCRGLVLLSQLYNRNHKNTFKIVLMNPITLEAEEVMNFPSTKFSQHRGLGYDSLSDDYKIVTVTSQSKDGDSDCFVDIYSVKAKTWRRVADSKYKRCHFTGQGIGEFLNGCIHWKDNKNADNCIAYFSFASEEFDILQPPGAIAEDEYYNLIVLGGCLSLVVKKDDCIDVWMMKEYGVGSSWMKLSIKVGSKFVDSFWTDVCCVGDDEILVVYMEQLMVFNWRNGEWRDVNIVGVAENVYCSGITFTPSLVSPGHNI